MKNVILVGDSIRMGYEGEVRQQLEGQAEVWSPPENCMNSVFHLFKLAWYFDRPADIIHLNCGLWDCRRLSGDSEETAVPIEQYLRNMDFIFGKLRKSSKATLIWATTTPIVEDRYNARFSKDYEPFRVASDVDRYNAAIQPILEKHNLIVNDLNSFVKSHGTEQMICEDGVHYTPEASVLLGQQVASVIKQALV